MDKAAHAYATYWRQSLVDSELGGGALQHKDARRLSQRPLAELKTGRINAAGAARLFADEPAHAMTVDVMVRPRVYLARVEHTAPQRSGIPDIVTPLLMAATVDRDGRFVAVSAIVVPRDILEPLGQGAFAVGSVDDLDDFLTREQLPVRAHQSQEQPGTQAWSAYQDYARRLLDHVCKGWQAAGDDFERADYYYLAKVDAVSGASRHIVGLYDHMRENRPQVPLFQRYADEQVTRPEPCLPDHAAFTQRMGHAGDAFALAPAQRDALTHTLAMRNGEVLAVNGPPGTGKTTLSRCCCPWLLRCGCKQRWTRRVSRR